jgi:hypothetical protein
MIEQQREIWTQAGLKFPHIYYWNVDARQNNILDNGPDVSYVSGCSPTIFKSVLSGRTGWDLCLEVLMSERYSYIV